MKITSVIGKDFLTLGEVEFELDDQGLVLVQGENRDDTAAKSNGSGKSSLVDLVCWTLWGTTARGSSGDAVIRDGTKLASGKVMIADDASGGKWEIERLRKKGKSALALRLHIMRGIHDHTQGTEKLTQSKIAEVLGTTEDVFRASIYMGQEQLVDLPAMTDRHLKMVVEEAAGVLMLEAAYEKARGRLAAVKADAVSARNTVISAENSATLLRAGLAREHEAVTDWDTSNAKAMSDLSAQIVRDQSALDTMPLPHVAMIPSLEGDIARLQGTLVSFDDERRQEKSLRDALSKAERAVAEEAASLKIAVRFYQSAKTALECVDGKLGEPCSECGTPLTATHLHVARDGAARKAAETGREAIQGRDKHTAAREVAEAAQRALAAFLEGMSDPSAINRELAEKREKLREAQGWVQMHKRAGDELEKLRTSFSKAGLATNPYIAKRDKLVREQLEADAAVALATVKQEECDASVVDHETAAAVFGPSGVRAHILDTVTPFLNTRTSEYLGVLSDGAISAVWSTLIRNAKGELREKFSIEVTHSAGSRGFTELSGGEKRKVRLACALALQDLVGSRASKPFNLFVADEIDHALDDAGLERLTTVLQSKAVTAGTVIVISHNALDSYIPTVWQVIKEKGSSSLVK